MHLLNKKYAVLSVGWWLEKSNTKSQWKAEVNVFGEYDSESRTWWSRIEYIVRQLIRKNTWFLSVGILGWVCCFDCEVCVKWGERTKRQGPTSMELLHLSGILLDTLDVSHIISADGWRGHHSLHFGSEEIEAKEIMKFAQGKGQRPGFKPDLSNTRVSAFCPRRRVSYQGQMWEGHSLGPGAGRALPDVHGGWEASLGLLFPVPLEGCLANHCRPGGERAWPVGASLGGQ